MNVWEALILGLVQGFTEFLPVSSSGHLVLLQRIFNIGGDVVAFDVMLHLASLVAVISVLHKEVWALIRRPFSPPALKLLTATVPTVVIVVLFKDFFESAFKGNYLGFGFLMTAALLLVSDIITPRRKKTLLQNEAGYSHAFAMGVAQGLAVIPGLSRSGTTMFTGVACGLEKNAAVRFSFLMSIPIIIGSAIIELPSLSGGQIAPLPLIVGFIAAFVSALISVKLMLAFVKKHKFTAFVIYLTLLGVFLVLNEYLLFLF